MNCFLFFTGVALERNKLILRATACGQAKTAIEKEDGKNIKKLKINNNFIIKNG